MTFGGVSPPSMSVVREKIIQNEGDFIELFSISFWFQNASEYLFLSFTAKTQI